MASVSTTTHPTASTEALEASIRQAFVDAQRDVPEDGLIADAAAHIAAWNDLDAAISDLAITCTDKGASYRLTLIQGVLLGYRQALKEAAEPALIRQRIEREVSWADAAALGHDRIAVEYRERATARRNAGWSQADVEEAQRSADAAMACAAKERARAEALRARLAPAHRRAA